MRFALALLCLILTVFADTTPQQPTWYLITNEKSELKVVSKVSLYKIFSCADGKYNALFISLGDDSKKDSYESFLKLALDDPDMNYVKFKSKNLTRLRKREPVIIKFYDTEEDIVNKVKEDVTSVGVITNKELLKGVKVCEVGK